MRLGARWRSAFAALIALGVAASASAQRPDSARVLLPPAPTVRVAPPDTTPVSPLTPRRAFLYSFLAPGYSQSVLGRNKAATGFLLFEAISLAMIRESAADVREARRLQNDTVVVSWVDASGRALAVPDTAPLLFGDREVRSRRAHVEDWIAVLVANHLFAGADAYVAAHLWDVKARVGLRVAPSRVQLLASIAW